MIIFIIIIVIIIIGEVDNLWKQGFNDLKYWFIILIRLWENRGGNVRPTAFSSISYHNVVDMQSWWQD